MKILNIKTYGIKNISNLISIDFSNLTIEKGLKNLNNVKAIFGLNGVGKTALITSVDFYKKITSDSNFLYQNKVKENLKKLINNSTKEFYFSMICFSSRTKQYIKHEITLKEDKISHDFYLSEEKLSLCKGRTLNENFETVFIKKNNELNFINNKIMILDDLMKQDFSYKSIISIVKNKYLEHLIKNGDKSFSSSLNEYDKVLLNLFFFVNNLLVYLDQKDLHMNYHFGKKDFFELSNLVESLKNDLKNEEILDHFGDEIIIGIDELEGFKNENKKLEKFIRIFKPDLETISLQIRNDGHFVHIRRIFNYYGKNEGIEFEFESSGIKHLVELFIYLNKCSKGCVVFIDEIDTNINIFTLNKIIEYFKNYGKGQLIFTSHNILNMNALRNQKNSIHVLGRNNQLEVWVGQGSNKSPVNDLLNGKFINSPMNTEDFDFINVFC